ncbi:MAG: ThuA domain-containing protein [Pirellulales bacterium]
MTPRTTMRTTLFLVLFSLGAAAGAQDAWVVYEGQAGPGQGKHIVLVSGDEEYRSEEALPMLGKILAQHHGFRCTVLFAINPEDGTIDPNNQTNIPGLEALQSADLMVIATRFRELPDEQMRHVVQYVEAGKPVVGLRTATHAFAYSRNRDSDNAKYSYNSQAWPGGFGQQVLGETWVSHHGAHGSESTRGVINDEHQDHPILRGVEDIWGPTDVYTVRNLPESAHVLVHGQVLSGMKPDSPPVEGRKNNPMMPLAWTKQYEAPGGETGRVFCTTMGSSTDLASEGLRRLVVNACYWAVGLEEKLPAKSKVEIVGEYDPTPFGFGQFKKGVKPSDHAL